MAWVSSSSRKKTKSRVISDVCEYGNSGEKKRRCFCFLFFFQNFKKPFKPIDSPTIFRMPKRAFPSQKIGKKFKLPRPSSVLKTHSDDIGTSGNDESNAFTRTTPHRRGNWSVHVFYSPPDIPPLSSSRRAKLGIPDFALDIEEPHLSFAREGYIQGSDCDSFASALEVSHIPTLLIYPCESGVSYSPPTFFCYVFFPDCNQSCDKTVHAGVIFLPGDQPNKR